MLNLSAINAASMIIIADPRRSCARRMRRRMAGNPYEDRANAVREMGEFMRLVGRAPLSRELEVELMTAGAATSDLAPRAAQLYTALVHVTSGGMIPIDLTARHAARLATTDPRKPFPPAGVAGAARSLEAVGLIERAKARRAADGFTYRVVRRLITPPEPELDPDWVFDLPALLARKNSTVGGGR